MYNFGWVKACISASRVPVISVPTTGCARSAHQLPGRTGCTSAVRDRALRYLERSKPRAQRGDGTPRTSPQHHQRRADLSQLHALPRGHKYPEIRSSGSKDPQLTLIKTRKQFGPLRRAFLTLISEFLTGRLSMSVSHLRRKLALNPETSKKE
jgi:hypothetical protein